MEDYLDSLIKDHAMKSYSALLRESKVEKKVPYYTDD